MGFSSPLFIFVFLPLFLLCYQFTPRQARNAVLLFASLVFYASGDQAGLGVLVASIVGNFAAGIRIDRARQTGRSARPWLILGILFNLALLGWYKYVGFLTRNADLVAGLVGRPNLIPIVDAVLPLGISFFAFQGMSYLIDVHRGTIGATHQLLRFATYKSLFPQLIAGPIVRYRDVAAELREREVDDPAYTEGLLRFTGGFCKKVLLADTLAQTADAVFALPANELSFATAWVGVIAYSLQIFFDFAGYSDMAIGLGRLLGFRFPENFNDPYVSRSIREFWRRWHMTLSSWFRDYVYVPLGGNRRGSARTYVNLMIVFVLTGFWHGASWTFVVWGLWHGSFMAFERAVDFERRALSAAARHVYALAVIVVGWVLFRANSFEHATALLQAMAGFASNSNGHPALEFLDPATVLAMFVAVCLSVPPTRRLSGSVLRWLHPVVVSVRIATFGLACAKVLAGAYSPFLYFRF
ncbi:MAG: MBOAT family protein [Dokdonella sp.]|uniref:MBOAT family O-acyltransferase n=1 Tax=Dokdonella sp. TaxID=2291710 RepID=UPI003264D5A7